MMLMLMLSIGIAGPALGAGGATLATDVMSSAGGTSTSVSGTIKLSDTFGQGPMGPAAVGATMTLRDGFWATISAKGAAADTTPPERITDLTATAGEGVITLRWTDPPDADFAGTYVCYSTSEYPGDHTEGRPVPNGHGGVFANYPASADSFVHTGLDADSVYYYGAFAFDGVPNYAQGWYDNATPIDTVPPTAVTAFTATAGILR